MAVFSYAAYNQLGKEVKGKISSEDIKSAFAELKKQELIPIKVKASLAHGAQPKPDVPPFSPKPQARDLSVFCRQFVSIIEAGVPVAGALEILENQTENKMLSAVLREVRLSAEKGESLAQSFGHYSGLFGGRMFTSLIAAGEASGSLSKSFSRMAEQFEKDYKLKAAVMKASVYPVIMLIVTFLVIVVVLGKVVPSFQGIFDEIGSEMPGITKFIISASDFVQNNFIAILVFVLGAALLLKAWSLTTSGKRFLGRLSLKLPVLSQMSTKSTAAKLSRTLSTLMAAGVPLLEAIDITADSINNIVFKESLQGVKADVRIGENLSAALKNARVFPPLLVQMLAIGEESSGVERMIDKVADYYDQEVEYVTGQISALIEPVIILLMAGVVGTVVMAVMMPIVNLYGNLGAV